MIKRVVFKRMRTLQLPLLKLMFSVCSLFFGFLRLVGRLIFLFPVHLMENKTHTIPMALEKTLSWATLSLLKRPFSPFFPSKLVGGESFFF